MNDFTFFKSFSSITQTELAKNVLESQGVNGIIKDSGVSFEGSLGDSYGANLFILKKEFEKAREILEDKEIQ